MKKSLFTLMLLLITFLATHAQFDRDTVIAGWSSTWFVLNFDNPNLGLIEFDPPENNVWQIGKPQKEPFAPFNGTGAIMTDTSHMLDSALEHSFILKFHRLTESNAVSEWYVNFKHIYQFDSLVSGGYISISYDKGASWKNVVYDDYLYDDSTGTMALMARLYDSTTIINNGQPALTGSGKTNGEYVTGIDKFFSCTIWDAVLVYDIWVKFTYINTGNHNPHAGWMIDDFTYEIITWCEYIYNDIEDENNAEVQIYPNPVKNKVTVNYPETGDIPLTLEVYDILRNKVFHRPGLCGTTETLDVSRLPNGHYLYHLYNHTQNFKGHFIIQK
jgi:hypothetical protein